MGTSARVLVLDDFAEGDGPFRDSFGEGLTICPSLRALEMDLAYGTEWDVAFVDFALAGLPEPGADTRTGLSGLVQLRAARPQTKIVSYTTPGESGRLLFMAAAKQWFAADATLAKSVVTPQQIADFVAQVREGRDPTDRRIRKWLERSDLIDQLLKTPDYAKIWQAWRHLHGNEDAILKIIPVSSAELRHFKSTAQSAVVEFKKAFEGVDLTRAAGAGKYNNYKGVLSEFAGENRIFFDAPDLADAMAVRPRPDRH